MTLTLSNLNYLAVLAAAVGVFLVGGLWYTALFGNARTRLLGWTPEDVARMQQRRPPPVFFGGLLVSYVVLAFAVAVIVTSFGISTAGGGAAAGLVLWLAIAAVGMTQHLPTENAAGVYLIDTAFQFVALLGMGALLGGWQ